MNGPAEWLKILPVRSHMSTSDCPSPGYTNLRTHPAQTWDLELDSALLFLSMRVSIDVYVISYKLWSKLLTLLQEGPFLKELFGQHHWVDVTLQTHRRMPKETNQSKK